MTVFGKHFEVMPQHRIPVLGFPYQQEEKKEEITTHRDGETDRKSGCVILHSKQTKIIKNLEAFSSGSKLGFAV